MKWTNPLHWFKLTPERYRGNISGVPTVFEIDSFGIGCNTPLCYGENEKYVKLKELHFILDDVINKLAKALSNANFTDSSKARPTRLLEKLNEPNQFQSKEEFLKEFGI